ncbi:MAG: PepSY-like domain-containing protein [Muribaculum sp.]|nr:PepSY-like domain-containing protein [Muribaculum sp.]
MKKTFRFFYGILAILAMALAVVPLQSCGDDDDGPDRNTVVTTDDLPNEAQAFISEYFNGLPVRSVVRDFDTDSGTYEYEVRFSTGLEITFTASGMWIDVEAPSGQSIPDSFILAPIKEYILANYPGASVHEISRDAYGYDVELTNGVDLQFDLAGQFIRIDK